jgi:hypothetical protein
MTQTLYNLQEALQEFPRVNVIEWYILPEACSEDALWVSIGTNKPMFPSIRFHNPVMLEEYRYKELIYSYDRSNDGQRTISRQALKEDWSDDRTLYRILVQEDILPSHRFPCSADIEKNDSFVRRSFKINNRLFLIEETLTMDDPKAAPVYQYYLRYNHALNVDVVKMQDDLNQFIRRYKF